MRILILANFDAGLYKFRKELIQELVKEHQVSICLPKGEYTERLINLGCHFIPCNLLDRRGKNPLKDLKLLSFYKETLKAIKPDIVFTYTIKPNVYGGMACASLDIPYVANITGLGSAVENGGLLQKLTLGLYKVGLRKAKMVFFQNKENQDFMLRHGIVQGAYDLLPGSGVNLEEYKLLDYPNGDTIDFIFVARVMKEKGIDQYLEAAKYIRKKYPQTRFHVCGFCEENYKGILKQLNDDGTIIYHGQVDNMIDIYRIAACTVHPTYYPEGLSNVLLESAASGRPIITTNRSGCREVVENGVNGFFVRERDSKDLQDKIDDFVTMIFEERERMGMEGRRIVSTFFDRKIVCDKYIEVLK